jgi:hyaluronoglucosaminidase
MTASEMRARAASVRGMTASGMRAEPARARGMRASRMRVRATLAALAGLATLAGVAAAVPAQATGVTAARALARSAAAASADPVPAVWPTPQQETPRPRLVHITPAVTRIAGAATDPAALTALAGVLRANGVQTISNGQAPGHGLTIYVGTPSDNPLVAQALQSLGAPSPDGLAAGGYVLAVGGDSVVLAGADAAGTFYAVQTLRQLITRGTIHDVVISDWPSMPVRGVIEGFYGPAWTDSQIASQLRFYGATKLNTFVYSAKGDPYLRAQWQDLYPAGQLAALGNLATLAQAEHVNFVYALSPGLSVCYSDPTDLAELEAKDQQLWNAGVRQFALFFDDIGSGFNCAADQTQFGSSPDPLAAAQAYLINAFVTGFIDTHPGAQPMVTVPTDYSGTADSAYREVWKSELDPSVLVYWTGVGVIPTTITAAQAQQTASEFGHKILVWDNYPVNDYQPTRLFLGPLVGRAADLDTQVAGFTSNPMQEPAPSTIPEFTTADYTWNSPRYAADPDAAWNAGIDSYGGPAAGALAVFAANNQSTPRIGTLPESPELAGLISAFQAAYQADAGPGITTALRAAAARLEAGWARIAGSAAAIDALLPHRDFVSQAGPWLDKFRAYGQAGVAAVQVLLATKAGDTAAAAAATAILQRFYAQASAVPEVVGEGVFQSFFLTADPSLFPDNVSLYAADAADYQAALTAASAAGLPASQVTQSYDTAWKQASSGEYLVIAVGGPADTALYYNVCGWDNPSGLPGGSTPFYYGTTPVNSVPPMDEYVNGAGQTAADTAALSAGLAYYAAHGTLPPGVTSLPAAAAPVYACSGSPSG